MVSTKMEQYQHIRKRISNHTAIDNNDEKKKKKTQQNFFSFQYAMSYQIIVLVIRKKHYYNFSLPSNSFPRRRFLLCLEHISFFLHLTNFLIKLIEIRLISVSDDISFGFYLDQLMH